MNIGESIRVGLFSRNKKAVELAKHAETTSGNISQIRSGASNPSLKTLCKMADFFEVQLSTFIKWGEGQED